MPFVKEPATPRKNAPGTPRGKSPGRGRPPSTPKTAKKTPGSPSRGKRVVSHNAYNTFKRFSKLILSDFTESNDFQTEDRMKSRLQKEVYSKIADEWKTVEGVDVSDAVYAKWFDSNRTRIWNICRAMAENDGLKVKVTLPPGAANGDPIYVSKSQESDSDDDTVTLVSRRPVLPIETAPVPNSSHKEVSALNYVRQNRINWPLIAASAIAIAALAVIIFYTESRGITNIRRLLVKRR